jgi:hypothetical protein
MTLTLPPPKKRRNYPHPTLKPQGKPFFERF